MKNMLMILALAIALLTPGMAQAYMVYNHIDSELCIIDAGYPESCNYTVPADENRKIGKGWAQQDIWANWNAAPGDCYLTDQIFGIPQDGSAKFYKDRVEVFDKAGELINKVSFKKQTCAQRKQQ